MTEFVGFEIPEISCVPARAGTGLQPSLEDHKIRLRALRRSVRSIPDCAGWCESSLAVRLPAEVCLQAGEGRAAAGRDDDLPDPSRGLALLQRRDTNPMTTPQDQPKNPLHGVTLERMLTEMVAHFGWTTLGERIPIRCFLSDPSVSSSLKFLRKTPWAREKVEGMYLYMLREQARRARSQPASP